MTQLSPTPEGTTALLAYISDCQRAAAMLHGLSQGAESLFSNISTEVSPEANAITPLLDVITRGLCDLANQLDSIEVKPLLAEGRA